MQFDVSKHCAEPCSAREFQEKCLSFIPAQNIDRIRKETTIEDIISSQNTDEETAKELAVICDPINLKVCISEAFINRKIILYTLFCIHSCMNCTGKLQIH